MGQRGTEAHHLLVPLTSTTWELTCGGGGGVLVRGGTFNGASSHGSCSLVRSYRDNFGTRVVTLLPGSTIVEAVCAHYDWGSWQYASSTGAVELSDGIPAADADVLVVGGGLGGHAAASASVKKGTSATTKMVSSGSSTTQLSTGVVWFPINHTLAELSEAHGFSDSDTEHMKAYLRDGKASYEYWKPLLDLRPYPNNTHPVPDYTQYALGPKVNNSFQSHSACGSLGNGEQCGGKTLLHLQTTLNLAHEQPKTVVSVALARAGFRATFSDGSSMVVRTLVFANGGSGAWEGIHPPDLTLATSFNTGVHLDVAASLGMTKSRSGLAWGLEFKKAAGAPDSTYAPQWFSFGCAPKNTAAYNPCADYNRRVSAYTNPPTGFGAAKNSMWVPTTQCNNASFVWWKAFFASIYASYGSPVTDPTILDFASCDSEASTLAPGIIDGKKGFLLNPDTMESTDVAGIYAAGTTAAYGLGNTYFGPGATLGWALHSGRLAGEHAHSAAVAKKRREALDASLKVAQKRKRARLIILFRTGAWVLLIGVAFHVAGCLFKTNFVTSLHYLVAPAAAGIFLYAAQEARSQSRRNRLMIQMDTKESRWHAHAGRALVVVFAVQVGLGIVALVINRTAYFKTASFLKLATLGVLHRILGWSLLVLVAFMFYTSRTAASLYDDAVSRTEHSGMATAFASGVGVLFFLVLLKFGFDVRTQPSSSQKWVNSFVGEWRKGEPPKSEATTESFLLEPWL